jgi:hypothetical protein
MLQDRYTRVASEGVERAPAIQMEISTVTDRCRLTLRSSGRVKDKVPSAFAGVRAAQLNR